MTTKPATIFKYQSVSPLNLQNLKQQSFYFKSPTSFNDPYDCTINVAIDEPTDSELKEILPHMASKIEGFNEALKKVDHAELPGGLVAIAKTSIRNFIEDHIGVTCFSECKDNLLMWAHYGDSHQGFCLEFRTDSKPFSILQRVKYTKELPRITALEFFVDERWKKLFDSYYCTKSADWEYEKEWRIIHREAGKLHAYKANALKAIYFGLKMKPEAKEEIRVALAEKNSDVEFWNTKKSPEHFGLTFEPFT